MTGRRDRLRHQHHQAADRRPRPTGRRARDRGVVRLGQDVDRTGRLADEALARTFAALDEYAALIRGARRRRGPVRRDVGDPRRARTPRCSSPACASGSASTPEVLSGDEEAALSFDGAIRHLRGAPAARRSWSSTSAAARPSWSSARPRPADRRRLDGHRLGAAARAAPARRPADRGRGRRLRRPTSTGTSTPARSRSPGAGTVVGVAGTVTTLARGGARPAALRPRRDRPAPAPGPPMTRGVRRPAGRR